MTDERDADGLLRPVRLPESGTGERSQRRLGRRARRRLAVARPGQETSAESPPEPSAPEAGPGTHDPTSGADGRALPSLAPVPERTEPPEWEALLRPRPGGARGTGRSNPTLPPSPAPGGGPSGEGRRRLPRWATPVAFVVLLAAVPLLIWAGFSSVLHTTGGRKVNPIDDPLEAGYQANVAPTPTELVAEVDTTGALVGVVVISLPSHEGGGNLLFVPGGTAAPAADGSRTTLSAAYASGSLAAVRAATAGLLRLGFDGTAVLDPAHWQALLAPVSPITFKNPDRLPATAAAHAFPAATLVLDASEAITYLSATKPGESELNRMARRQLVWKAWLDAATLKGVAAIPGETATGFGRFIASLVTGPYTFTSLPVTPAAGSASPSFTATDAEIGQTVARLVPFPTSDTPGQRIRVRVLDGVGRPGLAEAAARLLVPAGAEVAIVGNADTYGHATTEVRGDPSDLSRATTLQAALGVGSVVQSTVLDDVVDVTIVLGEDFAARAGPGSTTTLAPSSGGAAGG